MAAYLLTVKLQIIQPQKIINRTAQQRIVMTSDLCCTFVSSFADLFAAGESAQGKRDWH